VQQVVDALERVHRAELAIEDASDVRSMQGAGAVPGPRRRVEPPAEPILLVAGKRGGPAGSGPLGQRLDASRVVAGGPGLDRASAAVQRRGDLLGGSSPFSEDDGLIPLPGSPPFLLTGQGLEWLEVVMGFDVHEWASSVTKAHHDDTPEARRLYAGIILAPYKRRQYVGKRIRFAWTASRSSLA
jgi:hypothetical protein